MNDERPGPRRYLMRKAADYATLSDVSRAVAVSAIETKPFPYRLTLKRALRKASFRADVVEEVSHMTREIVLSVDMHMETLEREGIETEESRSQTREAGESRRVPSTWWDHAKATLGAWLESNGVPFGAKISGSARFDEIETGAIVTTTIKKTHRHYDLFASPSDVETFLSRDLFLGSHSGVVEVYPARGKMVDGPTVEERPLPPGLYWILYRVNR